MNYVRNWSVVVGMLLVSLGVHAQAAFPSKTITVIVPISPGGVTDRMGRMFSAGMGKVLDYTLDYAKSRLAFGKPISKLQSIQHKLADMRIMAENARLLTYRVAELIDNGQPCVLETSMAKIVATDANFNCANLGLQIMGGAGYTCAYDMEMFFRDARVGPIGGGSNEIQRNIMAKLLDC